MGLSRSFALPVGRGSRRAVTPPWLSSIWRVSRFFLSRQKTLRPRLLSRIPTPRFSPIPHSLCVHMRRPSSHTVLRKLLTHRGQFGGKR